MEENIRIGSVECSVKRNSKFGIFLMKTCLLNWFWRLRDPQTNWHISFYISSQHKYVAILLYLLYHTEKVRSSRSPFQEFRVRQTEDLDKVVRCKIQCFPPKKAISFWLFFYFFDSKIVSALRTSIMHANWSTSFSPGNNG